MGFMDKMKGMQQQAQDAMANSGGMQGAMGGGDMAAQAAYAQLAQKLGAAGVEAPGTLNTMTDTGETDPGGSHKVEFAVTIAPSGGEPYQATISQYMLPAQLEGMSEGGAITVKFDPDNPQMALIYGW
jgi:hypothetical protein